MWCRQIQAPRFTVTITKAALARCRLVACWAENLIKPTIVLPKHRLASCCTCLSGLLLRAFPVDEFLHTFLTLPFLYFSKRARTLAQADAVCNWARSLNYRFECWAHGNRGNFFFGSIDYSSTKFLGGFFEGNSIR